MGFNTYYLKDVTLNISDGVHNTVIDDPAGTCFLLSAKNIKNGRITFGEDDRRINESVRLKLNKRTKMAPGDVLITTVGAIGELAIATNESNIFEFQRSVGIIKTDNKKLNNRYLYYLLRGNSYNAYFHALAIGAAQQCIFLSTLKKLRIQIPEIAYQEKVSAILSRYDELIEKNDRRIAQLESMAEQLYKEWFVRFRFDGSKKYEMKDSELGKIPACFNILKVRDVLNDYIGGGWGNDDYSDEFPIDAYVIRGTDFPFISKSDVSTCPYRYHKKSNYRPRQLKENDIILEISGGTAEQPVGRAVLVSKGVLDQLDNKVICASFCKLLRPNYSVVTPYYFNYWLKFLYETRMIEKFQLQSTGIINFKFEYFLNKGPILIPPVELMKRFDGFVRPLKKEIDILALENANLMKQRDSLLPRLMSGKLSVEGKEIV